MHETGSHVASKVVADNSLANGGIYKGTQKIKIAPIPFRVNSSAYTIEGEKVPINYNNKQPLSLDLRLSATSRRVTENSLSIYNSKTSHVDRLCPWKLGGQLLFDFSPNLIIKACHVCTASSAGIFLRNERKYGNGLCDIIKLPFEFRLRQQIGPNKFLPNRLKYVIFALTAREFTYKPIFGSVFANENVTSYTATNLFAVLPDESDSVSNQNSSDKKGIVSFFYSKSLRDISDSLMVQYREIKADMTGTVLYLFGYFLMKFIRRIYDKIIVAHAHIQQMQELAANDKTTTIYLPLHKSHMDYLLISLILWQYGLKWPHIIAGNNLKLPIISWLLSRMGAVFIQRGSSYSLNRLPSSHRRRNYLRNLNPFLTKQRHVSARDTELSVAAKENAIRECYSTMLKAYTEEMLSAGWPLEVYLEGGRSRTGKPISEAKVGIMKSIVDGLEREKFEVNIVPVSISYDKVMDMVGFVTEMQGLPKKSESAWRTFKSIFRQLRQRYGCVRVHFGQPFAAKEMLKHFERLEEQQQSSKEIVPKEATTLDNREGNVSPTLRTCSSINSQLSIADFRFFSNDTNLISNDKRVVSKEVVRNVSQHCLYLAQKCTAVMSTHLVAFILLNIHRKGATTEQLQSSIETLMEKMQKTELFGSSVLGFTGEADQVLNHFLSLFSDCVTVVPKNKCKVSQKHCSSANQVLYPKLSLPHVFSLMYLSNNVSFHFVRQSVMATVILSLAGFYDGTLVPCVSNKMISIKTLLEECSVLCMLLKHEFLICAPCENIDTVMEQTLQLFETAELVYREQPSDMLVSANERERQERIAAQLDFDDESDSDFSHYSSDSEQDLVFSASSNSSKLFNYSNNNNNIPKDDRLYVNVEKQEKRQELMIFSNILAPVINCYWLVSLNLKNLLSRDIEYASFGKQTHASMKAKHDIDLIKYPESCCYEYVKNAIAFFVSFSVLRTYVAVDASTKLSLTDFYKDVDNLKELQNMFFQYKL